MIEKKNLTSDQVHIFVASNWKFDIYNEAYKNGTKDLIKRVMQNPSIKKHGKEASKYAQDLLKGENKPNFEWNHKNEWNSLQEAKLYIEEEIGGINLDIIDSESSIDPKSKISIPGRPGILFDIT